MLARFQRYFDTKVMQFVRDLSSQDFDLYRTNSDALAQCNSFLSQSICLHYCEKRTKLLFFWVPCGTFEVYAVRQLADLQGCAG